MVLSVVGSLFCDQQKWSDLVVMFLFSIAFPLTLNPPPLWTRDSPPGSPSSPMCKYAFFNPIRRLFCFKDLWRCTFYSSRLLPKVKTKDPGGRFFFRWNLEGQSWTWCQLGQSSLRRKQSSCSGTAEVYAYSNEDAACLQINSRSCVKSSVLQCRYIADPCRY